jgi:hypothetical protein
MVFEGIRSGEITLKEDKVNYTGPYLNPTDVEWPARAAKQAELSAYRDQLAIARQEAMDTVMLGDEAHTRLRNYTEA